MPPLDPAELPEFARRATQALRVDPAGDLSRFLEAVGLERLVVARDGGRLTAGAGWIASGHRFGGRSVPAALVTVVWAAPDQRGRGVASGLLRELLGDLRERGIPLSSLYPANLPLYRGLGYEVAAANHLHAVRLADLPARAPEGWSVEALEAMTPQVPGPPAELYEAARPHLGAGSTDRVEALWHAALQWTRGGATAPVLVRGPGGEPRGYALLDASHSDDTVHVRELVALDAGAARTLLAHLAGYRAVFERVEWPGGAFHPFAHLLRERPEHSEATPAMFRLLDPAAALAARGYPPGVTATVELEISDDVLPENAGRLTLELDGSGSGHVTPGGGGRVRAGVRELAVLYTGHATPRELILASDAFDAPAADLDALALAFAGPRPWIADRF